MAALSFLPPCAVAGASPPALRLILDTDFSPDADDVGAVAMLHNVAADNDGVEILAMMISSGDPWSPGALAFVNHYYGRGGIPLGTADNIAVEEPSAYTETLARQAPRLEAETRPAVDLYRQILAGQPDRSVTIVAIGSLTNLARLIASTADRHSPLSGIDLVAGTVDRLVCMGGRYPSGREWNFYQDPVASRTVMENWPTRIDLLGFELGEKVITGKSLQEQPFNSPLHLSYLLHNDFEGRPSWDQLAVLQAVLPEAERNRIFTRSPPGINTVRDDGSNFWLPQENGLHRYVRLRLDGSEVAAIIETLMIGGSGPGRTAAARVGP